MSVLQLWKIVIFHHKDGSLNIKLKKSLLRWRYNEQMKGSMVMKTSRIDRQKHGRERGRKVGLICIYFYSSGLKDKADELKM